MPLKAAERQGICGQAFDMQKSRPKKSKRMTAVRGNLTSDFTKEVLSEKKSEETKKQGELREKDVPRPKKKSADAFYLFPKLKIRNSW